MNDFFWPKPTWLDRVYYWLHDHFTRKKCDGCLQTFTAKDVTPVSCDFWLCEPCFLRWYPEYKEDG